MLAIFVSRMQNKAYLKKTQLPLNHLINFPSKVSESTLINNYYCRLPRDCQGLGTSNYSLFVSVREVRVLD